MNHGVTGVLMLLLVGPAAAQTREQAVLAAREGRLDEGINALRSLIANGDASPATALDLAVVLIWAKRPREATDVFEQMNSSAAPEYVLLPMTRAYWDQRRYDDGARLARQGQERFPKNLEWIKLGALIAGEAAERSGDLFTALREYEVARSRLPEDPALAAASAGVLARLGAPHAASAALTKPDPGLEAQKAGLMVRWGADIRPPDPARRYDETDAALARLDGLIAEAAAAKTPDTGLLTRLKRDRVVALRDRGRWAEAAQQADDLRRGGDRLPTFVREAEADSLLALRRPAEARQAYAEIAKVEPRNRDALIGRFYAEVETEDFRAAFATIDALAESGEIQYRVAAGQARNYADMNNEAWRRLFPLSRQAPALGYLHDALGGVAAARGWPRRAAEEVEINASLAPGDWGARVSLAESDLRLRRYAEARRRAAVLTDLYGNEPAVKRLNQEIHEFDQFELRSELHSYNERNSNPDSPGTGFDEVTRIYSRPMADRWRILGGFEWSAAEPVEGRVNRYRNGGGVELRLPSFTMEATGWSNTGTLHRGGAQLTLNYNLTDRWNIGADAQLFSTAVPLRALAYGITGNSLGLSTGYDWNESRGWAANAQLANFSDGNRRRAGGFRFVQRIVDRPHLKVTVRPETYLSANSSSNAPYFNPSRDFSAFSAVQAEHILWRRYERSFRQRFSAGAGAYWQRNYPMGVLANATYEQAFRFNRSTELRYDATLARRVYDGQAVSSLTLSIGIVRRF